MFLKLTTINDLPVIINMANTTEIYQMQDHTQIHFMSPSSELNITDVTETLDQIYQMVRTK